MPSSIFGIFDPTGRSYLCSTSMMSWWLSNANWAMAIKWVFVWHTGLMSSISPVGCIGPLLCMPYGSLWIHICSESLDMFLIPWCPFQSPGSLPVHPRLRSRPRDRNSGPTARCTQVLTHCNAGWLAFADWGRWTAPVGSKGRDVGWLRRCFWVVALHFLPNTARTLHEATRIWFWVSVAFMYIYM